MLDHQEQLQFFMGFIQRHPHCSGLIACTIAFCESLAVIGTLIPGSIVMTAIGILIGSHLFPPLQAFAWIISGGLLGDYLSYWVGRRYQHHLSQMRLFQKYPNWLIKGQAFFHQHGIKSILIGRFFGPMRSLVPLVAGMLQMSRKTFVIAMVPSIVLWAIVYTLPGILIGSLSLQLPPKLALTFLAIALLVSAMVWGTIWLIQHGLKQCLRGINYVSKHIWKYAIHHHCGIGLLTLLCPTRQKGYYHQLSRLMVLMGVGLMFGVVTIQVCTHGILTQLDLPLHHFFRSIRGSLGHHLMLVITMIADKYVLLSSALMIACYLAYKKHWRAAVHWVLLHVSTVLVIKLIKVWIHMPRPNGFTGIMESASFPSGHVTLFTVFSAFLALLVMQDVQCKQRYIMNYAVMIGVVMIALSRLYLGAHWLTDVLGGMGLGVMLMLLFALSYRRIKPVVIHAQPLLAVAIFALGLNTVVYAHQHYAQLNHMYQLHWPNIQTTHHAWWHQKPDQASIPHYRTNRFGKAAQPFNVQYQGSLIHLKNQLCQQGWQYIEASALHNVFHRLTQNSNPKAVAKLPMLPLYYHNQPPAILLVKATASERLVLRFWQANVEKKQSKPLWLGTVSFHGVSGQPDYNAVRHLCQDLKGLVYKTLFISDQQQPEPVKKSHWDGQIVLIKAV